MPLGDNCLKEEKVYHVQALECTRHDEGTCQGLGQRERVQGPGVLIILASRVGAWDFRGSVGEFKRGI